MDVKRLLEIAKADAKTRAARSAERHLGREVNVHQVAPGVWRTATDDPFLSSVRSRPLVPVDLAAA